MWIAIYIQNVSLSVTALSSTCWNQDRITRGHRNTTHSGKKTLEHTLNDVLLERLKQRIKSRGLQKKGINHIIKSSI